MSVAQDFTVLVDRYRGPKLNNQLYLKTVARYWTSEMGAGAVQPDIGAHAPSRKLVAAALQPTVRSLARPRPVQERMQSIVDSDNITSFIYSGLICGYTRFQTESLQLL